MMVPNPLDHSFRYSLLLFLFFSLFSGFMGFTLGADTQQSSTDVEVDLFDDPFGFGGLFDDPQAGLIDSQEQDPSQVLDISALTTDPIPRITGSTKLTGGFGFGLTQWPGTDEFQVLTPREYVSYTLGYDLGASVSIDVRPTGNTRFFTTLGASLDPGTLAIAGPTFGEFFVDYTLADRWFFRIGKQSITWGQGRLVGNPGNLVSRVSDGASVRAFVPLAGGGLTGVVYGSQDLGGVGVRSLGYGLLFETSFSSSVIGLSTHYRFTEDLQTVVYGRTTLGSADAVLEVRADWDMVGLEAGNPKAPGIQALTGFLWEFGTSPRVIMTTEYMFDSTVPQGRGHRAGLGLGILQLPWGGWRPGLSWLHEFNQHSGQVLLGIEGPLAPSLRGAFGLPVVYGPPGSIYRTAGTDIGSMVLGLAFQITLALDF